MQFREILNNFTNASIESFSNEIVYEIKLNEEFNIFDVIIQNQINIINNRNKNYQEVVDVFIFTIFDIETHYNNRYKVVNMKFNHKAYIKL